MIYNVFMVQSSNPISGLGCQLGSPEDAKRLGGVVCYLNLFVPVAVTLC